MRTIHRPGASGSGRARSRGRVAAAGGALAASAALLVGASSAHAQDPVWTVATPAEEAAATLKASGILEQRTPHELVPFCDRYPTACELVFEEPKLVPEPDPGPYHVALDDLVLGLQGLDVAGPRFAELGHGSFGG